MTRILAAAAAALLLASPAVAVESPPAAKKLTATARGKPQAPVAISAKLSAGRATVTVRFHARATGVEVAVHGVDGLVVTSAGAPLSGGRFARGEAVTLDVAFTEGATPGQLAVAVTGDFAGARQNAIAAFVTRPPTRAELKPSGSTTTDSTGQRIEVMPVEGR